MSVRIRDFIGGRPVSYILGSAEDPNGTQLPDELPRRTCIEEVLTFDEALRRYTEVLLSPFNVDATAFKTHAPTYFKRELAEAEAALKSSRK